MLPVDPIQPPSPADTRPPEPNAFTTASAPGSGPSPELMRSLGHLVRGLSALFWGLPLGLVVVVLGAFPAHGLAINPLMEVVKSFGMVPALIVNGLFLFGLWQLAHFQQQERVWVHALDRARLLCLVNLGLSPFLYWWNQIPAAVFFGAAVMLLCLSSLLFLYNLNHLLHRLTAMLPDETLRLETRLFAQFNSVVLLGIFALVAVYLALAQTHGIALPPFLSVVRSLLLSEVVGHWLWLGLIFFTLLPVATTMALLWKVKEVILASIFGPQS